MKKRNDSEKEQMKTGDTNRKPACSSTGNVMGT